MSSSAINSFFLVTVIAVLLSTCDSSHAANEVPWQTDLAAARQMATSHQKLLLIHFTADNCPPCRRLDKNVFNQASFAHSLVANYVPVKINVNEAPQIAQQFGVRSWPTDVIMTSSGAEITRMTSPQDVMQYGLRLSQVAYRSNAFPDHPQVASDYPLNAPVTTMPLEQPMMGTEGASTPGMMTVQPQPVSPNVFSPRGQYAAARAPVRADTPDGQSGHNQMAAMPASGPVNTYAAPQSPFAGSHNSRSAIQPAQATSPPQANPATQMTNPPVAAGQVATSGYHGQFSNGNGANPIATSQPFNTPGNIQTSGEQPYRKQEAPNAAKSSHNSSGDSAVIMNEFASGGSTKQQTALPPFQQPQTQPVTAASIAVAAPAQIEPNPIAVAGQSRQTSFQGPSQTQQPISLAMEGYCPVTLSDSNKWVKGDKRWGARHRGRVFLFQSLAAQQKFLADPEKYSPILVGYDPVALTKQGAFEEGKREHGIRYKDQIVLFNSESALEEFSAAPQHYMTGVQQAMQTSTVMR